MFVYAKLLKTSFLHVASLLFGGVVVYRSLPAGEFGLQALNASPASTLASWFGLARGGALLIDSAFQQVTKPIIKDEVLVHNPVNVSEVFTNTTLVWTSQAANIRPGVLSAVDVLEVAVPHSDFIILSTTISPVKAGVFDVVLPQVCASGFKKVIRKVAPKPKKTTLDFATTTCKAQSPLLALEIDSLTATPSTRSTRTAPSTLSTSTSSAFIVSEHNADARRIRAADERVPLVLVLLHALVFLYALIRWVIAFRRHLDTLSEDCDLVFTPRYSVDDKEVVPVPTSTELVWLDKGFTYSEGDHIIPESNWALSISAPYYETVPVNKSMKMDQSFFNVFVLLNAYILMQQYAAVTKRDVRRADVLFFASLCNPFWVQTVVAYMGYNFHYVRPASFSPSSLTATVESPSPGYSSRIDIDKAKAKQREHDNADKRLLPDGPVEGIHVRKDSDTRAV